MKQTAVQQALNGPGHTSEVVNPTATSESVPTIASDMLPTNEFEQLRDAVMNGKLRDSVSMMIDVLQRQIPINYDWHAARELRGNRRYDDVRTFRHQVFLTLYVETIPSSVI